MVLEENLGWLSKDKCTGEWGGREPERQGGQSVVGNGVVDEKMGN